MYVIVWTGGHQTGFVWTVVQLFIGALSNNLEQMFTMIRLIAAHKFVAVAQS